jgi:ribosome assembly protein 4
MGLTRIVAQVYAVDWAADGKMVGSGGKDKAVRTWRN